MKLVRVILFLGLILAFTIQQSLAQAGSSDRILLENSTQVLLAGKKLYFWEDKAGNLTIADMIKLDRQAQLQHYNQDVFTHKATKSVFWFKLQVQNLSQETAWIALNTTFLWYIDYYTLQGADYQLLTQTGTLRPQTSKAIPNQFFWFPLTNDSLPQTVYFRVQTFRPVEVPIEIGTTAALYENQRINDFLVAGFVGLILVMFVYNFFILLVTKDKIYFWYVAYLLSILFQTTYINNYPLFTNETLIKWTNLYIFVWGQQSLTLIIIFTIYFLDLPKTAPKSKYLTYSLIFILVFVFPLLNITGWVHYTTLSPLAQALFISSAFALLSLALYLWLVKKQRKGRFYTFAWISLLATLIVYFMVIQGILPYTILTRNGTFFGIGIEIVVFAIALADRINQMRSEKNQAEAENFRLIQEQNAFLEQKVSERTTELNQTNEELNITVTTVAKQRDDILSSINYALRIQNAIIPQESDLQKHLDCFVFFRPKDIVSGDFYWFSVKEFIQIIVVADCTGHGVSGAFMTMIGNNILNVLINDQLIFSPDEILNQLPLFLGKILAYAEGSVKDGMDIIVLKIDTQKEIIQYAGAKNSLYYIQNSTFQEIKADKMPIYGKKIEEYRYQMHERRADNMMLYLSTDGFQDQFGGENGKKFMLNNFKKLLFDISEKSMAEQKELLVQTFEDWKGKQKQTDDVQVLGIKI